MQRQILVLLLAISATFAATCSAATVSFTDSGSLSCGPNATCAAGPANTLTFSSTLLGGPALTVSYNAGGDTQNVPPVASANFGSIVLACAGCTTANNASWDLTGTLGTISFSQVLPAAGVNTLSGTFSSSGLGWSGPSGVSGAQTGLGRFFFAPSSMLIGSISYTAEQPVAGILLQLGQNSVSGLVNLVPEPATLALMGIGLVGLAGVRSPRRAHPAVSV